MMLSPRIGRQHLDRVTVLDSSPRMTKRSVSLLTRASSEASSMAFAMRWRRAFG